MRLLLFAAMLALPLSASADPITLIGVGASLGFTGTAALVAGAVVSYGGYALLAANAIYGSMDARRRARNQAADQRRAYNAGLQERNISALREDPAWRIVYGQCRTGGDIVAIFTSDKTALRTDGTSYTKPDAYKHLVVVLAAHECEDVTEMYIDGEPVGALDGSGWATTGSLAQPRTQYQEASIEAGASHTFAADVTVIGAVDPNGYFGGIDTGYVGATITYTVSGPTVTNTSAVALVFSVTYATTTGSVRWSKHLGSASQTADSYLTAAVPAQWGADDRLRGLTYVVVTLDLEDQRFQGGPPQMAWDVKGRKVYDPRSATTVWSDNPALCVRDYLTASWGLECTSADIDDAYTIAAANACDAVISVGKSYTCNGTLLSTDSRERTLTDLCDSMAGFAVYGARWQIIAGAWSAAVMALTDDDLAGQIEIVQAGVGLDDVFNGMRGGYVPADSGVASDFSYSNTAFVSADGRELWTEITLPYTSSAQRARNLARIMVEANRDSQVIRYPAKLTAWPLQVGDRVTVTSAEYGLSAKTYRVVDWQFRLEAPVMLTLQEDAAAIYDEADAATADPSPNTGLPDPWRVAAVGTVTAASGDDQLQLLADGTMLTRVLVQWPAVADAYVLDGSGHIEVSWRRVIQDEPNAWRVINSPGDATSEWIMGASDGDLISIGVTVINGLAARGVSTYVTHRVVGKTARPPDVRAFTVVESATLGRTYYWDYPDPPLDLAGFLVRYINGTTVVAWESMLPLFETGKLERSHDTSIPGDGEWTLAIRAVDTTGNLSLAARTLTVLFDQAGFGLPVAAIDVGALGWPGTRTNCGVLSYYLADAGTLTWDTIPVHWDDWTDWDGPSASPIVYQHSTVDVGSTLTLRLREGHVADGATTAEYQSSTDNVTYTAWAAVPAGTFSARYVRVRWAVAGIRPVLYRAYINLYS